MISLWAVILVSCAQACTVKVLEGEVYKGREDCTQRAAHLTTINPGKEFDCATIYRRAK